MVLATKARHARPARRTQQRKTRQRRYVVAMLPVLLAVVLGGCGSSVSQASFLTKDSSSAGLLQWTQTGHAVSGSLALATLTDGSLATKNLAFSGTISGSSVTLTFPQGFGTSTNAVGTISGSHLRLSLPVDNGPLIDIDFSPGTVTAYNSAVAVLTSKTDQACDSAVEYGVRSLEIGIQSYAVDHHDSYPAEVTKASLVDDAGQPYVDNWPKNPFTDSPMTQGTDAGDYSYTNNGTSFQLVGYGPDTQVLITVP